MRNTNMARTKNYNQIFELELQLGIEPEMEKKLLALEI